MKDYEIRQLFVTIMLVETDDEVQTILNDFFADADLLDAFEGMRDVAAFMTGFIQRLVTGQEESFNSFLRTMGAEAAREAAREAAEDAGSL